MNWETGLRWVHCFYSEETVDELGDRTEVGPLLDFHRDPQRIQLMTGETGLKGVSVCLLEALR
jgi:hypothetical protein